MTGHTPSGRVLLVTLLVLAVGTTPPPAGGGEVRIAQSALPESAAADACALYTLAEVAALYSEAASVVTSGRRQSELGDAVYCIYTTATGYFVTLTVLGQESVDATAASYRSSQDQLGLTEPVSGLGHEAALDLHVPVMGAVLMARRGRLLAWVSLVSGGNAQGQPAPPLDDATATERVKTIMGVALSRLP